MKRRNRRTNDMERDETDIRKGGKGRKNNENKEKNGDERKNNDTRKRK